MGHHQGIRKNFRVSLDRAGEAHSRASPPDAGTHSGVAKPAPLWDRQVIAGPRFQIQIVVEVVFPPTQPWPSMGRKESKRGWFPFPYPPVTGLAHRELMNDVADIGGMSA